ncbi:MAG: DNA mismatch endonuclease Vsr [Nitrospinae bacterium]|nr:DNA mismatch endonuclease Vsr [Nitrospinota bacterium]
MDKIPAEKRSSNMRAIRSKDTGPELVVRRLLRRLGFTGYRIHAKELPGKPDIVFIGRRKAIFVHGCFWHGHGCKEGRRKPKSNLAYWLPKIKRNRKRDATHMIELTRLGWSALAVWECEINATTALVEQLLAFVRNDSGRC